MLAVQAHRGPDDHGVWLGNGVCLGHRRLSIIDLSPNGRQPMCNENGTVWIVFNGEVYNYAEIGRALEAKDHVMRSASDTEVVLHAYEEWGESCFRRFNGMWGLVLWDSQRQVALCSRDRFGVKPLYYHASGDRFAVASEIKGILAAGVAASVAEPYAAHVIAHGRLDDWGSQTLFTDIYQLPAANTLRFSARDGVGVPHEYWRLDPESAAETLDYSNPADTVRELLSDAVRVRMLASDVPVGCCLSGGLDSSSIVALAARDVPGRLTTFTVEYPGTPSDESRYSRLVAEHFGCDSVRSAPDPKDYLDVLEEVTWYMDEPPVSAPGVYSQWKVFQLAGSRVKVVLDGQGGDELMGGYHGHVDAYMRWLLGKVLSGSMQSLGEFLRMLPEAAQFRAESPLQQLGRVLGPQGLRRAYREQRTRVRAGGISLEFWNAHRPSALDEHGVGSRDPVNEVLLNDLLRDILPAYLHYEDRLSMGSSVESRTPFLDYRLVEYMFGIPGPDKLRAGNTKTLLREAMSGITPQQILDRKDKMGFATPTSGWFRNELREAVRDYLLDDRTRNRGVLDMTQVERAIRLHGAGKIDAGFQIFQWLALECWFRCFLDRSVSGQTVNAGPRLTHLSRPFR